MSNVELYSKVCRVIMSCKTEQQLKVAEKYVKLSQSFMTFEWNMDVLKMFNLKEREMMTK